VTLDLRNKNLPSKDKQNMNAPMPAKTIYQIPVLFRKRSDARLYPELDIGKNPGSGRDKM
jgi:hypothetical protein